MNDADLNRNRRSVVVAAADGRCRCDEDIARGTPRIAHGCDIARETLRAARLSCSRRPTMSPDRVRTRGDRAATRRRAQRYDRCFEPGIPYWTAHQRRRARIAVVAGSRDIAWVLGQISQSMNGKRTMSPAMEQSSRDVAGDGPCRIARH